jgi:peptidoglycan/xylan/chitin deacetylase (PgdA/CDA1 family)
MRSTTGVVLLYHRVGLAQADPWGLAVTPENFAQHMALVCRDYRPTALRDLVHGRDAGAGSPRVAVTFDDGYAETATQVLPMLQRLGIPATFFIPSGSLDSKFEFWWDELEAILLSTAELPDRLVLQIDERTIEWTLGHERVLAPSEADAARWWRAWELPPPGIRQTLYLEIWRLCQRLSAPARASVIDQLRAWSGTNGEARPEYRALRADEAASLSRGAGVEIGGHTISHPSLASLPRPTQAEEILGCKQALERVAGCPVASFAYPFGKPGDYSAETADVVRDAGFDLACVNLRAATNAAGDVFHVPRVFVANWTGETLARTFTELLPQSCEASR